MSTFSDLFRDLTRGRSRQLEKLINKHEETREKLLRSRDSFESARRGMDEGMADLGSAKMEAIESLKLATRLLRKSTGSSSETYVPGHDASILSSSITHTIDEFESGVAAVKGLGVGAATSAGAWALVSTFGSASTGAAIGALNGVAATNATLAWFGGGAVAAGGGGMAAGTLVLGGIVAIPMVIFAVWKMNKSVTEQMDKVESQIKQMETDTTLLDKMTGEYRKAPQRLSEVAKSVRQCDDTFRLEYAVVKRHLFPWGIISWLWRHILRLFTGRMLRSAEIDLIQKLEKAAAALEEAVKQRIFDDEDCVSNDPLITNVTLGFLAQNPGPFSPHKCFDL